ncbi:MAG: cyclic nucleotide-binding domain-containing protein [Planctomicrobium sp.]|jgi:CRP/FNR family transcriptional regulator, cyclic AMP receptor protein|nr:cyclic nucleotide-binding domain-containing protein [Planctomicrobium sp.]
MMSPTKMEEYRGELKECKILENLEPSEIDILGDYVGFRGFSDGDEILTEGLQYQGLWLILRGKCDVLKDCGDTKGNLAQLEPGSLFGEMSFFETVPHSATVRAIEDTETVCMSREEFDKLQVSHPGISHKIVINIVKLISDRLRQMDSWTCRLVESEENSQKHQEWHDFRARLYSNLFD